MPESTEQQLSECPRCEGIGCHPTDDGYVGDCEACGGDTCEVCNGTGKVTICGLYAIYVPGHCARPSDHAPAADHVSQFGVHFTRGLTREEGGHE